MNLDKVKAADIDVANYIEEELKRQQTTIELIASENFTSLHLSHTIEPSGIISPHITHLLSVGISLLLTALYS